MRTGRRGCYGKYDENDTARGKRLHCDIVCPRKTQFFVGDLSKQPEQLTLMNAIGVRERDCAILF